MLFSLDQINACNCNCHSRHRCAVCSLFPGTDVNMRYLQTKLWNKYNFIENMVIKFYPINFWLKRKIFGSSIMPTMITTVIVKMLQHSEMLQAIHQTTPINLNLERNKALWIMHESEYQLMYPELTKLRKIHLDIQYLHLYQARERGASSENSRSPMTAVRH